MVLVQKRQKKTASASIGEITQLFNSPQPGPQKSRFIADVTLTEPPLSRAQVLAETQASKRDHGGS